MPPPFSPPLRLLYLPSPADHCQIYFTCAAFKESLCTVTSDFSHTRVVLNFSCRCKIPNRQTLQISWDIMSQSIHEAPADISVTVMVDSLALSLQIADAIPKCLHKPSSTPCAELQKTFFSPLFQLKTCIYAPFFLALASLALCFLSFLLTLSILSWRLSARGFSASPVLASFFSSTSTNHWSSASLFLPL